MAYRRKYYKKKKYYKNNYYETREESEAKFFAILIIIGLLGFYSIYIKYIKPNFDNILLFLKIFIPILIIITILVLYYKYKKKKKIELEKINNLPNFLLDLENKIKNFKPLRKYSKEEPYQIELAGFLKNSYPDLDIEKSIEYSRPDIIIDNIAIEIKGPTNMSGLKTLPDKINSYLPKRDYLFIVLFNIQIVDDEIKNIEIYENKKKEILENTIDSKKEKIFFIEI